MKVFYRSIIFSKTPLKGQFRYKDKFQILPVNSSNAPLSPYNEHFPLMLEYSIDFDDENNPKKMDVFDNLSAQQVAEFEIMNALSVFSNHRFFKYNTSNNQWAILVPNTEFEELTEEQKKLYDNQYSSWTLGCYVYPGLRHDLKIHYFSDKEFNEVEIVPNYYEYFTHDPFEKKDGSIKFPETIFSCLDSYYALSKKTSRKIKSSIALICDGIDISEHKRSLAFLSFVSAIEALIELEYSSKIIDYECSSCKYLTNSPYSCPECGRPIWGIKAKFREFLKKFVAGSSKSIQTFSKIYNLRSQITHQGQLFIGDYEFSLRNRKKKDNDWLMKHKTLQLARLAINNWLRYPNKASY